MTQTFEYSQFFSIKPEGRLIDHKNIFVEPTTDCSLSIEFDNQPTTSIKWMITNQHPTATSLFSNYTQNMGVRYAAQRRACLDYRSLLEVSFRHGNAPINLFQITVEHLLKDYEVTVSGGGTSTIGELWQAVLLSKPNIHNKRSLERMAFACTNFNNAFNQALPLLIPQINLLIQALGWQELEIISLNFNPINYHAARLKSERKITNDKLIPTIQFRQKPIPHPQSFLNEARLSALALAIYLAGRLVSVPTDTAGQLKLLVLDDVLVGLDHANRIPVLDVLKQYFSDWQIVLLTHDRLWFEIANARAQIDGNWGALELFCNHEADAVYKPFLKTSKTNVVDDYLQTAEKHLANNDWRASAVYARSAFEMWLKLQCDKNNIPVAFSIESRKMSSEDFLCALEKWAKQHRAAAILGVIKALELYRNTVFNPASHSHATTMNSIELKMAIKTMRFANKNSQGKNAIEIATSILNNAPTSEQLMLAAAYIRVHFNDYLYQKAEGKKLSLAFKKEAMSTPTKALWYELKNKLWMSSATWTAQVEQNATILFEDWGFNSLQGIGISQLQTALHCISQQP